MRHPRLLRQGSQRNRDGMARYAIVAPKVFGVSVAAIRVMGKDIGRDHDLALALWKSGWYEARMLTAFVDDPARVTPAQMDRWAKDFDNWAICDTLCFHLFDKVPHAWGRITAWSRRREEFVRRAAFALIAGVALHDKKALDAPFMIAPADERAATDNRNFVKKGGAALRRWSPQSCVARRVRGHSHQAGGIRRRHAGRQDAPKDLMRPQVVKRVTRDSQAT